MKNYIKSTITLVALLLCATTTLAGGKVSVNGTVVYDYNSQNTLSPYSSAQGTVAATIDVSTGICTLTVTPAEGYFVTKDNIKVIKTVDGSYAQTRNPGINTPLEVSGNDVAIGPEGKTYTFGIVGMDDYDYEATVDFQPIIDITNAAITLSESTFTYDGTEKKPTVASVKLNSTELNSTYYAVSYSNNVNAAAANATNAPTVTVTGSGIYKNAATKTFTINKVTVSLSYSKNKAEAWLDETFTAPTLNNPTQVAVTYSSSNTNVATISDQGVVTLYSPGETTITASYAGDENHEAASASYTLTVYEADPGLSWSNTAMEYFLGDLWNGPSLNNPNNLKVTYKSSNEEVATIDEKGVVTPLAVGKTKIMAIYEGDGWYYDQTVSYELSVKERYNLLVNDTRVTSDNNKNVLGDGHFFYDENTKQLVVTSNESPVTIESRMKNLTIFLNGSSKLERIFFNNEGDEQNTGSLTFTTYENIPGKVVLETSHADGVISGFNSLTIDNKSYTYLLDPEDGKYEGGKLVTAVGAVAMTATIGQYLKPLVNGQTVTFPPGKFSIDDLTNNVIDEILYTMVQRAYDSDEDDDYYDPVESAIVLNNLNSTNGITLLLDNVEKGVLIPGTNDYAEQFKGGITFMVPNGEGTITLNLKTEPGYKLMLMIGKSDPKEIVQNERGDVQFTYDVESATYCCIYLVQTAGTRGTRLGKRNKAHGKVYSVQVDVDRCTSTNPLSNVAGFPEAQTPEVETGSGTTGIISIPIQQETGTSEDNRWFTLSGQQVEQPTKPGLYIRNKKVIIIK